MVLVMLWNLEVIMYLVVLLMFLKLINCKAYSGTSSIFKT